MSKSSTYRGEVRELSYDPALRPRPRSDCGTDHPRRWPPDPAQSEA